jgi:hypothetical protein
MVSLCVIYKCANILFLYLFREIPIAITTEASVTLRTLAPKAYYNSLMCICSSTLQTQQKYTQDQNKIR